MGLGPNQGHAGGLKLCILFLVLLAFVQRLGGTVFYASRQVASASRI